MSTRPPVSTAVDHAAWEAERKRLESVSTDAGGTVVKIADPILDNRWAMLLGGVACSLITLIGFYMFNKMESFSTKQDVFLERIGELKDQIGQDGAERAVMKVQINAIEHRVTQHDGRLERLEAK